MMDIAIVQLASWGDVIISTLIPKAIRDQRPDWHITYYTTSACEGAVLGNPHIHKLVVIPGNKDQAWAMQNRVIADARKRHEKVIAPWAGWYPQHEWLPLDRHDLHHNFMWAYVRSAQLQGLSIPIPPTIYLYLTPDEQIRASAFMASLGDGSKKVLMEVEGHSGQSWMRQSWIKPIMEILVAKYGQVDLLISKGGQESPEIQEAKALWPGRVHLLNGYTLREVAGMFNSCDIFIGCSSGTSNACHAHCCKSDIRWFEAVKSTIWDSRPLRSTGKTIYYGEDPNGFFALLRNEL